MSEAKPLKKEELAQNRSTWKGTWIRREERAHNSTLIAVEKEAWLDALRVKGARPKTVDVYGNALQSLGAFLEKRERAALVDVTADDLEAWRLSLIDRGLASGTLEAYTRAARHWFRWLTERGSLFENPAAGFVIPLAKRKLLPVPTPEEMRRLLATPNPATPFGVRDRAFLETAYACGARHEELHTLDIHDLDLSAGTVRVVGKGRKERVLPLTKPAVKWLSEYTINARPKLLKHALDEPALWIDLLGQRVTYAAMHAMVKRHAKAAGIAINVTPHTLRRACATHLLQNGVHVLQLQALLGHATLKHLSQYLRLSITELQAMHRRSKPGS